jgi:hypothetical protein
MSSETVATVGAGGISSVGQNTITAIDILLEPDATMIQHAEADNARLLQHFPKGYSLGRRACATHLDAAAICPHRRPGQNLCSCRHGVCQRRSDQLEAEGVQVLLHSGWAHRSCRHRNRAHTRPAEAAAGADRCGHTLHCPHWYGWPPTKPRPRTPT